MQDQGKTKLPLTQSQLSIWASQKLQPDSPSHNIVYTFEIEGPLNTTVFKRAFANLTAETDIFNITFGENQGEPFQLKTDITKFELPILDVTSLSEKEVEKQIYEKTLEPIDIGHQVFDALLLQKQNSTIWLLKFHHLVTDAISYQILYRRLSVLYANLMSKEVEDKNIPGKYLDYVLFENDAVYREGFSEHSDYWKEKSLQAVDEIKFYGEKKAPNTTAAERIIVNLGSKRLEKLKTVSQLSQVRGWTPSLTLYNIFMTVYASFIHRVTGSDHIAIGSPSHNRNEPKFNNTPGLFVEVLPYYFDITEKESFQSLLQKVKIESNNFLKNVSPGMVGNVKDQQIAAVLNFINAEFPDFHGMPTKVKWVHNGHIDDSHDIRCHIFDFEGDGDYYIAFDLNTSVFNEEKRRVVPQHFLLLLDAFLENLQSEIASIPLVKPTFSDESNFPQQNSSKTKTLYEEFKLQAEKNPNSIALQSKAETLTYRNLFHKVDILANHLISNGVQRGSKVALHLQRSTDYVISVLSILKIGAVFVPIATDQPLERLKYNVHKANCSFLLCQKEIPLEIAFTNLNLFNWSKPQPENFDFKISSEHQLSYILFTSGSTGNPKGVAISNGALINYLHWAKITYEVDDKSIFPLFTSIGFDLTITSLFLPLISGGKIIIYPEKSSGPDTSLLDVVTDNLVNTIKLTPSHLALLADRDMSTSKIDIMILGGEDLKVAVAKKLKNQFHPQLRIINEYGPTEATVGCIYTEFDEARHDQTSVPIGKPIDNTQVYILDQHMNMVPNGVQGELYLSGKGLAEGYVGEHELTTEKFLENPYSQQTKIYKTGDLARRNTNQELEFLGRIDDQIKLRGHRIELSEIEAQLLNIEGVESCSVVVVSGNKPANNQETTNCVKCGLPSNYPSTDFDELGVCHLCRAFESYEEKAHRYFKNDNALVQLLTSKREENPNYDCISLLSGGKDSTYVLARLVNMGLKVLAFTMDNGYISQQAKVNIDKIVKNLGVDHVYGKTPHMNEIFVDSLHRHQNVCNGCFKTIYTLSTSIALEKQIPFIVTGLSRGQFFETRLTEELFWDDHLNTEKIDQTILDARKLYHQENDAVKKLLDTSMFDDECVFEKIQYVDFYRYSDVSLDEMLQYLKDEVGWVRPTDTGRSTNCLINQVGIYVHKKELGYSNYSFPYSWDVRLGHKTREETLDEINEVIDETEVKRIMSEIGYSKEDEEGGANSDRLVAYYTGNPGVSVKQLNTTLREQLPSYMVPSQFKQLNELPLTKNGKVDKKALQQLTSLQIELDTPYEAPRNEIEELLEGIWKEVLKLDKVGIHDDFIALGGHSLAAIRVTARLNEEIETNFPLNKVFEYPSIKAYANYIEKTLTELLEN
nr:amino acid adenylation domain-containing protein [Cytophaga sp. FL35]